MKKVNINDLPLGRYKVKYEDEWIEAELVKPEYIKSPVFEINGELVNHEFLDSDIAIPVKNEG